MAKTQGSQCRGPRFEPWSGNQSPQAATEFTCPNEDPRQPNKYFIKKDRNRGQRLVCRCLERLQISKFLPTTYYVQDTKTCAGEGGL